MIKVIFDISDPEQRSEILFLIKSGEKSSSLESIHNKVRSWLKHGNTENLTEEQISILEEIKMESYNEE